MAFQQSSDSSDKRYTLMSLRDVTKSYGRRQVLRISQFDIEMQDSIYILGSNGSGKSTLLRLLAGITQKSSGQFFRSPLLAGHLTGVVPQTKGINPDITVARNLRTFMQLYDRPAKIDLEESPYVVSLGLVPFLDRPVANLSGGFQKLAALAAVLSIDPGVIFLDEPFSGLDRSYRDVVSGVIEKLATSAALLVVTGHSPDELNSCKRRVRIADGEIQTLA